MNNCYSDTFWSYINGNYIVFHDQWGNLIKRAFRSGENLISDFPDSIDLKITNKCSWGCPFCHESSTPDGKVADIEKIKEILSQLPEGYPIEIAIGGGNVFDSIEETQNLVDWIKNRGHCPRITINVQDLSNLTDKQSKLIDSVGGLGVSLTSLPEIKKSTNPFLDREYSLRETLIGPEEGFTRKFENTKIIIHIIAGVFPISQIDNLFEYSEFPILILGYKQWGRAKDKKLPRNLDEFARVIKRKIYEQRTKEYSRLPDVIGFDNLALEQLDIKSALTSTEWGMFYMGDEGSHSMYIDAVEGKFAKTSRSEERVDWNSTGLIKFFKSL